MNLKHLSDKFLRLGNVIYWIFIILSILFSSVYFLDSIDSWSGWVAYTHPLPYLYLGISLLLSFLVIEAVRRVLKYVSSGDSLFRKSLPFGANYYLLIIVIPFILSLVFVVIGPKLEKSYNHTQALREVETFETFLSSYGSQLKDARECYENAKEEKYQSEKTACDANYRRVKMGYDSCMTYGWRTMCLQTDDYEVIDCSKETIMKNIAVFTCVNFDIDAKKAISKYAAVVSHLNIEERMKVWDHMLAVIKENSDSMLGVELLNSIKQGNFKEESATLKQK
ncbi:MAG: hypothetical protein FGM57_02560 [Candidatus Taylorbacteria bacterium]|nr:hypothetical protein [Candidatus Taylorbacteria bacterium]